MPSAVKQHLGAVHATGSTHRPDTLIPNLKTFSDVVLPPGPGFVREPARMPDTPVYRVPPTPLLRTVELPEC